MASYGFCHKKKMKITNYSSTLDRISSLPEEILLLILSFVDMKQIVQMSTLSKQWRYLWKSVDCLNFDACIWFDDGTLDKTSDQQYERLFKFIEFVTKVVNLSNGCSIKRFHICCCNCPYENVNCEDMDKWINSLLTRSVEEVCFEEVDVMLSLLQSLGNRIKNLKLINANIVRDHSSDLKNSWDSSDDDSSDPENSSDSDNSDDEELRKLNLTCSTLENCTIDDKDELNQISIHAPCLKFLMIASGRYPVCCRELRICAPNLKELQLKGGFFTDYSLEKLFSLDNAQVDTTIRLGKEKDYAIGTRCLNKLLKGLVHTKSLTLSADAFQWKIPDELPRMFKGVKRFSNLRYFKLTKWHSNSSVPALAKLFERFPCMETLVLEKIKKKEEEEEEKEEEAEEWEKQFESHSLFNNLKSVEIKGIEGSEDELKFLKFVLKKALVLKKVTITPTRALTSDALKVLQKITITSTSAYALKKLVQFRKKIHHLPRSSSEVVIVLNLS